MGVAHGRMGERELSRTMEDFASGKTDVLVTTAIVESGLDIPRANTIVVNDAHAMGLADLYQLKGRVGRSDVKAYAHFLVPSAGSLTEEARKRTRGALAPHRPRKRLQARPLRPGRLGERARFSERSSRDTWRTWDSSSTWNF